MSCSKMSDSNLLSSYACSSIALGIHQNPWNRPWICTVHVWFLYVFMTTPPFTYILNCWSFLDALFNKCPSCPPSKDCPLDAYSACYQLCNRTRGQRGLQPYKTCKNIDAIYQCLKRMQEIYTDIHKYYKHNLLCKYFRTQNFLW